MKTSLRHSTQKGHVPAEAGTDKGHHQNNQKAGASLLQRG